MTARCELSALVACSFSMVAGVLRCASLLLKTLVDTTAVDILASHACQHSAGALL